MRDHITGSLNILRQSVICNLFSVYKWEVCLELADSHELSMCGWPQKKHSKIIGIVRTNNATNFINRWGYREVNRQTTTDEQRPNSLTRFAIMIIESHTKIAITCPTYQVPLFYNDWHPKMKIHNESRPCDMSLTVCLFYLLLFDFIYHIH